MQNNTSVILLDTSLIIPNKYQPRKIFDDTALNSLAESIKNYGIINPILVRKKDDKYEIIAGERRFRAAKKIGLTEVPVIIKNADEQQIAELALIENIQRQGLSPIEEAKSYEEIMRIGNQTQASLAEKLGKSQSTIANKIRLLSLPQEIQDALANKKISERHARSLIIIEEKEKQLDLLNRIITEKLTVKETEQIIKEDINEDDEIKKAINDILKSLNSKEEEKEDDNMNNGNFFPNYDNNNNVNNNTSLNMMNMQSLNQPPMQPAPEMVMPTPMTPQEPPMQPIMNAPVENTQMINQYAPNLENNNINPIPNFMAPPENFTYQQPEQPIFNVEQPIINPMADVPLFNTNVPMQPAQEITPMLNNEPNMQIEAVQEQQPTINPVVDIPLFNSNAPMQPTPEIKPMLNEEPIVQVAPIEEQEKNVEQYQNPMVDIPLFNPEVAIPINEPVLEAVPAQSNINEVQNIPAQIVENTPVMQEPIMTPAIETANSYDIPVTIPSPMEMQVNNDPVIEVPVAVNRLIQLQDILSANGYDYRVFSNETAHCIIIDLAKN